MAESETPPVSPAGIVAGFIVALLVIINFVENSETFQNYQSRNPETREFSISRLIPQGTIETDAEVATNGIVSVRQEAGGSILGEQEKVAIGTVVDGPVEAFDSVWWRVNFPEPPSGWVEEQDLTTYTGTLKAINVFPFIYDKYLNIWLFLTLIFVVALIGIKIKSSQLDKFIAKKKKVESGVVDDDIAPSASKDASGIPGLPTGDGPDGAPIAEAPKPKPTAKTEEKWQHIQSLLNSHNTNDWKQAVIEADIILEDMLKKMGYAGEGIGEMLKNVDERDFTTLNKAWDAHKVRNQIAHKGSEFKVSKQEAKRVIGLYEKVFKEFYYI